MLTYAARFALSAGLIEFKEWAGHQCKIRRRKAQVGDYQSTLLDLRANSQDPKSY